MLCKCILVANKYLYTRKSGFQTNAQDEAKVHSSIPFDDKVFGFVSLLHTVDKEKRGEEKRREKKKREERRGEEWREEERSREWPPCRVDPVGLHPSLSELKEKPTIHSGVKQRGKLHPAMKTYWGAKI
jgi:hypothetical protein